MQGGKPERLCIGRHSKDKSIHFHYTRKNRKIIIKNQQSHSTIVNANDLNISRPGH